MWDRGTKPNSSMIRSWRRASCRCRLSSRRSSLASMSSLTRAGGGGEAHRQATLAGGQSQAQGDVGLAGAAVADGDDVFMMLDVLAPGQLRDQWLVHRGDGGEVKGVQSLGGGKSCGADPALDHTLVAIGEFHFGEAEQVVGVADALGGALGSQLAILPQKVGSLSSLRWCSKSSVDWSLMPPSPTTGSGSLRRGWSAR